MPDGNIIDGNKIKDFYGKILYQIEHGYIKKFAGLYFVKVE